MGLTALDIMVLITVGVTAAMGVARGFVTEVLSLLAWLLVIFAVRMLHSPLSQALAGPVGTEAGAAVLALAVIGGVTYFGGRMIANSIGKRTRTGILGPLDRALGLGFGALKALILSSLVFLLVVLVIDTMGGGPAYRPDWITQSRTYPLLNATSASIAEVVDRRRRGQPMWGDGNQVAPADNAAGDTE
jgi:membrane protein required for colicin V production